MLWNWGQPTSYGLSDKFKDCHKDHITSWRVSQIILFIAYRYRCCLDQLMTWRLQESIKLDHHFWWVPPKTLNSPHPTLPCLGSSGHTERRSCCLGRSWRALGNARRTIPWFSSWKDSNFFPFVGSGQWTAKCACQPFRRPQRSCYASRRESDPAEQREVWTKWISRSEHIHWKSYGLTWRTRKRSCHPGSCICSL